MENDFTTNTVLDRESFNMRSILKAIYIYFFCLQIDEERLAHDLKILLQCELMTLQSMGMGLDNLLERQDKILAKLRDNNLT